MTAHFRVMAAAFRRVLGTCLLFVTAMTATAAIDLTRQVEFNVPPQALTSAIIDFSRQADVQVLASGPRIDGTSTKGVRGRYSIEQGLKVLLEGTGMSFRVVGEKTISLTPGNSAPTDRPAAAAPAASVAAAPPQVPQGAIKGGAITVTATKREERLVDVPISVGVVTRDEIERRRLVNAEDYLRGLAGVNQVDGYTGQSITIRGIESSLYYQNFFTGTTVATYFGETPTTNTGGTNGGTNVDLKLVDVERVEVLRGPQGTAFGSSSMGGTVRTIPVGPRLSRFEGSVAASYSATAGNGGDNYSAQGVLNLPFASDTLAVRAVGYRYNDSGFYRQRPFVDSTFITAVVTPNRMESFLADADDIGAYSVTGGRIAALYRPNAGLKLTFTYLTQRNRMDGTPLSTSGSYEQASLMLAPQHRIRGQNHGRADMDIDIANAVAEYNLGWGTMLATYSNTRSDVGVSFARTAAIGDNFAWSQDGVGHHRENVGEIRVSTQFDGPWNFIAGLYAEKLTDEATFDNFWHGADPTRNPFGTDPNIGFRDDRRGLRQKAAFGEASWEFLRGFTLTGGIRAYQFERIFKVATTGRAYAGAAADHAADADGQTYRANLSYKPNDLSLLYAGFSQGFRLGQMQIGLPPGACDLNNDGLVDGTSIAITSTRSINSDKVDNYEVGGKFEFLDRRLTMMASAFHMKWSGIPVNINPGSSAVSCQLTYLANAGSALSDGIELEAVYQVTPSFRADASASWIDARLNEAVPVVGARKGNRLPGSPKVNARLGVQFDFDAFGRRPYVRADAVYIGSFYGDLLETPATKAGGYTKVDASAGVKFGRWGFDFFVRNVTNEDAYTFRNSSGGVAPVRVREHFGFQLRPRTIGVQAAYTF